MKFKLDENLGAQIQELLRGAGHDVQTVRDQRLEGCSDRRLYDMCCAEQRCLVTLDLDFADVTRFPPGRAGGIVVFRLPRAPSYALLGELVRQFLQALSDMSVDKELWIVEPGRIRIHESEVGQ